MVDFAPITDGEKIPDALVTSIFRPPPDVPRVFLRSSLIIGARGGGKTMLLRYEKERHKGLALNFSLSTVFAPITTQTGSGPLAYETPAGMESAIPGMATSLLSINIAERLLKKGGLTSTISSSLLACLPTRIRETRVSLDDDWLAQKKMEICRTDIEEFAGISEGKTLSIFIAEVGKFLTKTNQPLLLLLDKADQVTPASLIPVIELLDQSDQFLALIAFRPGLTGRIIEAQSRNIIPGDHYQVVHLGRSPRSPEWKQFIEDAVSAQLPMHAIDETAFRGLDPAVKNWIILLSRDSIRTALELSATALSDNEPQLLRAASDAQETLYEQSKNSGRQYTDLKNVINDVRRTLTLDRMTPLEVPINLRIEPAHPEELLKTTSATTALNRFIGGSLRCGAFSMPTDKRWMPGSQPLEVELAPLLLWREVDRFMVASRSDPIAISKNERELKPSIWKPMKSPTVFVAYEMDKPDGIAFRKTIETAANSHPDLEDYKFIDGKVPVGTQDWAQKIRERIKGAKVVVGDITHLRSDVLFEMGFAYGLGKRSLLVAQAKEQLETIPEWLQASQLGFYSGSGMRGIIQGLALHVGDLYSSRPRPISPVHGSIVWLRDLPFNEAAKNSLSFCVHREGLQFKDFARPNMDYDEAKKRASQAALLVTSLDKTWDDAFVHYVCGAVAAKQGQGPKRKIIVLKPGGYDQTIAAPSLRRFPQLVTIISSENLAEFDRQVATFCRRYNDWADGRTRRKTVV